MTVARTRRSWAATASACGDSTRTTCRSPTSSVYAENRASPSTSSIHQAQAIFADLVRQADIVVENFSGGTAERLGVGYSAARAANPRIIYCSISGFGQEDSGGKAMDNIIQALSGIMLATGGPQDPPVRIGIPTADTLTPLFGVIGILSALEQRHRTGLGQYIDVSMLGTLTSVVAVEPFDVLERLGIPMRTGPTVPRLAPFGVYPAADGHVVICAPGVQAAAVTVGGHGAR